MKGIGSVEARGGLVAPREPIAGKRIAPPEPLTADFKLARCPHTNSPALKGSRWSFCSIVQLAPAFPFHNGLAHAPCRDDRAFGMTVLSHVAAQVESALGFA